MKRRFHTIEFTLYDDTLTIRATTDVDANDQINAIARLARWTAREAPELSLKIHEVTLVEGDMDE